MGVPNRDIIGTKINNLTILSESGTIVTVNGTKKSYKRIVSALCDCGVVKNYHIKAILNGGTKSCGCKRVERISKIKLNHGLVKHPLYKVWKNMKSRCLNPKASGYKWYGGSGVSICPEWNKSFESFYNWAISNGWETGLQLDKDTKGNGKLYSPDNCTFVTAKENSNYRRNSNVIEYNGVKKTVSQWADYLSMNQNTLRSRLFIKKLSVHDSFTNKVYSIEQNRV